MTEKRRIGYVPGTQSFPPPFPSTPPLQHGHAFHPPTGRKYLAEPCKYLDEIRSRTVISYFSFFSSLPLPFGILALDKFLPDSRESRGGKDLSTTGLRLAGIITIITTIDNGLHRERERGEFNTRGESEYKGWRRMATGRNRRGGVKGCIQLSRFIPSSPEFFQPMEILLYIYIYYFADLLSNFSSLPPPLLSFSSSLSADLFPPFFVSSLIEASNFRLRLRARIQRALLCRNLETRERSGAREGREKTRGG